LIMRLQRLTTTSMRKLKTNLDKISLGGYFTGMIQMPKHLAAAMKQA